MNFLKINLLEIIVITVVLLYAFLPAKYNFIGAFFKTLKNLLLSGIRKLYIKKHKDSVQ